MNKKNYLLIVVFIVVVILVVVSFQFKPSTSVSSYRSEMNGNAGARVAKWQVTGVTKKNGESISLDVGFKDNIVEGTGNWFFEIENASEVNAAIHKNSTITLRLDGENLSPYGENINWNFLNNIDNPVNFKIYVYLASAEELLIYQNKNVETDRIDFTDYAKKSDIEKKEYIEIVNDDGINKVLVLDTQNDVLVFEKKSELVDAQIVSYYECTFSLSDKVNDFFLNLGFADKKTNISFRVEWSIDSTEQSGDTTDTETMYSVYKCIEGIPSTTTPYVYTIDGKNYYIDIQEKNFFDYLKYTSSLGGEPRFEFKSESSLIGAKLIVPFSQLTEIQKREIEGYQSLINQELNTLEDIQHLTDYLEYMQYKLFNEKNKAFTEKLPYLSMGLKFSVQFDLRVEQVD